MQPTINRPSIGIQVVLFQNPIEQLRRLSVGLETAVRRAAETGVASTFEVTFGDSSPAPVLSETDLADLRRLIDPDSVHSVTSIFFGENLGSGGGSQRLIESSTTDLVWILNPDTVPSPDVLVEMMRLLGDDTGAVDARQIPVEHPGGYDPVTGEAAWISGSCVLLRRAALDSVGGFDPHFFPMYCDDVDLSWRLRLAGWTVRHASRAAVFHDKRLDADGRPGASDFEHESGVLARLFLAHRYARPDVVAATLQWVDAAGEASHRRAVETYRRREADHDLPEAIPGAHTVADLDSDYYGPSRFAY